MLFNNLNKFVTSSLLTNNLGKKVSLREKQDRRLRADVDSVLSCREWIRAKTHNNSDSQRILGVVAAGKGSENYLPYTIPKIIRQISEIGMMADIIIGLNNGFECEPFIKHFALLPNVQVLNLYTDEKFANNIPAKIFDNYLCEGEPYYLNNLNCVDSWHRIFVVHQKEGEYAAGKIRILGDIYGSLLLKSIKNGWIPPTTLIAFDAESQFLVERNFSYVDSESNGLMLIINELQNHPEIDIIGAREKCAVYHKQMVDGIEVLVPNFTEEVPPIQFFLGIVHGRHSGFKWKPAVGTIGKTDALISLFNVISERYPGTKNDDTHLTILAKYADFIGDIHLDVIATNRTPSISDITIDEPPKKAWIEQASRWNAGLHSFNLYYGEHNINSIVTDKFPWSIFTEPIDFLKRLKGRDPINIHVIFKKIKILAIIFLVSRKIRNINVKTPEILQGSKVKASW